MRLTDPWREVMERFLIELLELNTLNESTFHMNFCCIKSTFLFATTIFDKVLKLVEGAIKPLQRKKTLKSYLHYKTIFCRKVALDAQLMNLK